MFKINVTPNYIECKQKMNMFRNNYRLGRRQGSAWGKDSRDAEN
jgi:hypothetical protein